MSFSHQRDPPPSPIPEKKLLPRTSKVCTTPSDRSDAWVSCQMGFQGAGCHRQHPCRALTGTLPWCQALGMRETSPHRGRKQIGISYRTRYGLRHGELSGKNNGPFLPPSLPACAGPRAETLKPSLCNPRSYISHHFRARADGFLVTNHRW